MVVMGSENKNLYGIDQNINNLEIEKHNEILRQIEEKKGKLNLVNKITSPEKINNFTPPKNQISYEIVNNVTQNRINQKSPYQNALLKINKVPHRHFPQQPSRKRF
jgi:hypothetical protein